MSYNHHHHPYGHPQAGVPIYPGHDDYADIDEPAVSESRPDIFPASHPLFTREEISNTRTLDPYPPTQSPHSWAPYEHHFHHHQPLSYAPYPSPSPFPPQRLSTPHAQTLHFKTPGQGLSPSSPSNRLTLAGTLDISTNIFYRTPEHPRLRTAQACEKCRTRKAKCSGEHPSCHRCHTRGLVCEYAKEGRVRGPNKPKAKASAASTTSPSASSPSTSTGASAAGNSAATSTASASASYEPRPGSQRPPSSHSSGGSSDQTPNEVQAPSLFLPTSSESAEGTRSEYSEHQSISDSSPLSSPTIIRGRSSTLDAGSSTSTSSRQNSLGEQSPRSQIIDAHLETASSLFRLTGGSMADADLPRLNSSDRMDPRISNVGPPPGVRSLPSEESNFSLYQQHHQLPQHYLHRVPPQQGYPLETTDVRPGQHARYAEQSYPPFGQQRDSTSIPAQQPGFPTMGGDVHPMGSFTATQSRRMMSAMRTSASQGSVPVFPSHQNYSGQQSQHLNLVPIQVGLNLSGEQHPARRREFTSTYSQSSSSGMSFFQEGQYVRPGRASDNRRQERCGYDLPQQQYRQSELADQHQQHNIPSQHESQLDLQYPGQRTQGYASERSGYEDAASTFASPRTASATSSSSTLDSGSPLTPATPDDMLLYHFAARASNSELHALHAAGSSSSLASAASMHSQRALNGNELHGGIGVEGEGRGIAAAVQHRGNDLNPPRLAGSGGENGHGGHESGMGNERGEDRASGFPSANDLKFC